MRRNLLVAGIFILLGIFIVLNPLKAGNVKTNPLEYGSYADAIKIVQETMRAYYIRGSKIQYNYAKTSYPIGAPEEATEQDNNYSVCAAYTYSVYAEAFGIKYKEGISEFPRYNYNIIEVAKEYYNDTSNSFDGNFLVYYEKDKDDIKYIYGDNETSSESNDFDVLIDQVKPGDLFVYTGHALIAYGVEINPRTGKKDILILNSTSDEYIRTRIDGTSRLSYNAFTSPNNATGILDKIPEGTIQFFWLSDSSYFMDDDGNFDCQKEECAIVRIFYNNNGNAVFNYNIDKTQYEKGKLRTEYPGLLIEKTVNVGDNNSVYINDEITYTIKITNKSSILPNNSQNYTIPFYISENLGNYVEYKSSTNSGNYSNGKITWKITSLKQNESIELKYTVKVKDNLNNVYQTITATGNFYSQTNSKVTLTTGTVKNKIIPKVNNLKNTYKSCYETYNSTKTGITLINEIYKCVTGTDFKFTEINFDNMFTKTAGATPKSTSKIKKNPAANATANTFYSMILNNYFNGLLLQENIYYLPRINSSPRAKTINSNDFKNGDVLIYYITNSKYTKESGLYAYIYIDGKFVGKNLGDNITGKEIRTNFEYTYYANNITVADSTCQKNYSLKASTDCNYAHNLYEGYTKLTSSNKTKVLEFANYQTLFDKDYYVILRPELAIQEVSKIQITKNPSKLEYIQNKETLNIADGKLTIYYNNGSTEILNLNDSNITIANFDNSKLGKVNLNIEYKNLKTTLEVEVIPKEITSITISSLPSKLKYIQSYEKLNLAGGKILVTYNDGTKETIDMNNQNIKVTGFNNTKVGKQNLTLTYKDKNITFEVEIISKKIKEINIVTKPTKTTYILKDEKLNLTGGKLNVLYSDNTKEIIELTSKDITTTGFDNNSVGKNTITIIYKDAKTSFEVEIISKEIKEISVVTLPQNTQKVENITDINLSTGKINVTYQDGTNDIINMSDKNIKIINIDNSSIGISNIKLEYLGYETTFSIEYKKNNHKKHLKKDTLIYITIGIGLMTSIAGIILYNHSINKNNIKNKTKDNN